jgi:hypothetical protein
MTLKKLKSALLKGDEVKTRDLTESDKLTPSNPCYLVALKTALTFLYFCWSLIIIREATFNLVNLK